MPYVCRTEGWRYGANAKLDTRNLRLRLKARREPYWRSISEGLAVGYRRGGKGGTWIARHYSSGHGRRYQAIGATDDIADADGQHVLSFAQAQEAARAWFADVARRDRGEAMAGCYTVRQCVDEYVAWLEAHRKTGADARYRVDTHVMPTLGPVQCATLTTAQIQNWLRDLANSPARLRTKASAKKANVRSLDKNDPEAVRRRRASANRTLVILKAALNSAWRAGKIHSDQAWRRVAPFKEADAARVRYLAVAEAKRLVDSSAADFRQLVRAALVTGARYGELASLRASDFNADSGTVHVRTSKSGKARHIVLGDEGVAVFKSFVADKSGEMRLLARSDGTVWRKSLQARPMAEACKCAKIEPEISFHVLRHTWASLAVMAGVPLLVVARNLGHADTRMVEKHYGHLAPSYIVDAIRASGPRFGIETDGISSGSGFEERMLGAK